MTQTWRTIVVDPPWDYRDPLQRTRGSFRSAESHYTTMRFGMIMAMKVGDWAETDAHLYLWTTNSFMVEAHQLALHWGFTPRTILTWVKPGIGMGHFYRNNTEHVVFAVRGRLPLLRRDLPTAFKAKKGEHSEKPQAFYDMVETASPGPYLDVFARKQRLGWDVAGNEVYSAIPQLSAASQGENGAAGRTD